MALVQYGGLAAESFVEVDANGLVKPVVNRTLNGSFYDAEDGGNTVQPLDSGGDPITISTDAAGGSPDFYVDDTIVTQGVWVDRGEDTAGNALARKRLHPHNVGGGVPAADESTAGVAEIATQAEVDAGLDDQRTVTPLKLANRLTGIDGSAAVGDHEGEADPHPQYIQEGEADEKYVGADQVGQPEGVAGLDFSGMVDEAAVPTVATPQAGKIPRYNGTGGLAVEDPVADRDAANRRWTLAQISALSGIQPPIVLGADQSVLNSTTTVTITGFSIPVTAGERYIVYGLLNYEASTTGDIKVQIDVPTSGLTLAGYSQGHALDATAGAPTEETKPFSFPTPNRRTATHGGIGLTNVHAPIRFEAHVGIGTNGTMQIQFAQEALDAADATTIFAGSYVLFAKVAAA